MAILNPTDPGTLTIALYTVLFGLAALAYFLGRYTAKVDAVVATQKTMEVRIEGKLELIFSKLEVLATRGPHICMQIDKLAHLEADIAAAHATLVEHGQRMDRIQAIAAHDREIPGRTKA